MFGVWSAPHQFTYTRLVIATDARDRSFAMSEAVKSRIDALWDQLDIPV